MTDTSVLEGSVIGYSDSLALFARPLQNVGVRKIRKIALNPVTDISKSKIITFEVQNSGLHYIDLSKTLLKIRAKIIRADGSEIPAIEWKSDKQCFAFKDAPKKPGSDGDQGESSTTKDIVSPVQNFLHSLFQRVDVKLQDCVLTDSDENYPYLAFIKALQASNEEKKSTLQMQLYFENEGEEVDGTDFGHQH